MGFLDNTGVTRLLNDIKSKFTAPKSIAYVESTTAKTNHATGDHFMIGEQLKRATSAIATGETIGTSNSTDDTLQGQIDTLRDSVSIVAGSPTITLNSGFKYTTLRYSHVGHIHWFAFDIQSTSGGRPKGQITLGWVSGITKPIDGATTGALRVIIVDGAVYDGISQFIPVDDSRIELRAFSDVDNSEAYMGSVLYIA